MLLVEDNPDDEALIRRSLQKNSISYRVEVVRDGEEALNYCFASGSFTGRDPQQPKFILLDLKLPKLTGLEVLRRLRDDERTILIPVIIFTSSNEEKEIIACYQYGANSYVRKSVDFGSFSETLRSLCLYWFNINEAPGPAA
jgi:CheY-like chemotaxis protein